MKTQDGKLELPVCYLDIETNELAEEVGGWKHVDRLTMGVGVTYDDSAKDGERWRIWKTGMEIPLLQYLHDKPLIVAHNAFRFDLTVLWGALTRAKSIPTFLIEWRNEKPDYMLKSWAGHPVIDTLATIKEATGKFVSLDNLGESTVNMKKAEGMSGAMAPTLLQQGEFLKVITYCKRDVEILSKVFRFGVEKGQVWYIDPYTHKPRYARPGWTYEFSQMAKVRGTKVRKKK